MSDSQFVGWWNLGYVEDDQQPIIDGMETERTENDSGLFVWFENEAEAEEAADSGLAIVEVDGDFDRSDMDAEALHEQADANRVL